MRLLYSIGHGLKIWLCMILIWIEALVLFNLTAVVEAVHYYRDWKDE